jgi:pyruvate dehydrogenase E2 component (dihydrolipoamide acetyltransferase)
MAEPTGPHGRIIERDIERLVSEGKLATFAAGGADEIPNISGTGLGGRITTADLAAKVTKSDMPEVEEIKLSNIRKLIAKSMHSSLSEMAQLTLNASFDATSILEYRKLLKQKGEAMGMQNVTITDMILFAVSRVLLNHRELNAHLTDDSLRLFKDVHLGVATDTPRGLMVPNIFNANSLSLAEISEESKRITGMCKAGSCSPDLLSGGSFTVTNLGSLGIESFTPVINPPQTAILGVCAVVNRVREAEGKTQVYPAMGLSVTFDHRAVDGAPVARFMQELCRALENFPMLLGK